MRGINGFYTQSGQIQSGAVKPLDDARTCSRIQGFIGSIFGRGGGDEHRNAQFLAALQAKLGDAAGRSVYDDLQRATDPESTASVEKPAPYNAIALPTAAATRRSTTARSRPRSTAKASHRPRRPTAS